MPGHRWITEFPGEEAFFLEYNDDWNKAMKGARRGKRNDLKKKVIKDSYTAHRVRFVGRMDNWDLPGWGRNNGTEEQRKAKAYEVYLSRAHAPHLLIRYPTAYHEFLRQSLRVGRKWSR
jgi:hypothetical protein